MIKNKGTILLINPGHDRDSLVSHAVPHRVHRDIPPVSILTLASYLEQCGEEVVLVDTHLDNNFEKRLKDIFDKENIILVGLTTFIGSFISNAKEITAHLKSCYKHVPVVWGGPLTSTLPDACLKEGGADYIVFFSGEEPLRMLISGLRGEMPIDQIPNIGFLKDGQPYYTRENTSPVIYNDPLNWGLLGERINLRQVPYLAYLFSSKGCPYGCRFCYYQMSSTRKLRKCFFREAESILREIGTLKRDHGITVFTFGDDNFFSNKIRAVKILDGMRENGCYIEQAVGTFNDFNDEIITKLQGICQTLICSIEAASERLLKLINKPIKLGDIPRINSKLAQAGINTIHSFMFGLPGETDEERRAAVELMMQLKNINPYVRGMPYFFTPLPGTPMFEDIEQAYGSFPHSLSFWEECEIIGTPSSYKFRPWIGTNEQEFITEFITLFKDLFQSVNEPPTEKQKKLIRASSRLNYIFSGINNINFPRDRTPRYLLDKILSEECRA